MKEFRLVTGYDEALDFKALLEHIVHADETGGTGFTAPSSMVRCSKSRSRYDRNASSDDGGRRLSAAGLADRP